MKEEKTEKKKTGVFAFLSNFWATFLTKSNFLEQFLSNFLKISGNFWEILSNFWQAVNSPSNTTCSELENARLVRYTALPTRKSARQTYYTGYYPNKIKDGIVISRHHQHRIQIWRQLQ